MAEPTDVKQLLLQVDASVELLRRNMLAGDMVVANFDRNVQRRLDDMDRRFEQFGKGFTGVGPAVARTNAQIGAIGATTLRVQKQVEASTGAIRTALLASTAGLSAAFAVSKVKEYADGYTRFTNQLKVAGLETSKLASAQESLFGIAQKYGVELESIGTLYGRAAQAGKALGASQGDLLRFTTGVAAGLKIQGGRAEETKGALLQLSQLLGTGTVRAEEFNAVNEGARPILQAVASGIDKYKGSIAELRKDVIAGSLTSQEFFQGFLRGSEMLEQQATKANLTLGASFTILNNALGRYIGQTDQTLSATERFGAGIQALAANLDIILPALTGIAVGYAAIKAGKLAFDGVTQAVATAAGADRDLAAQVLAGNASFVDRATIQAKIAVAAREAAIAEVQSVEATLAAQREEAAQLEANLALIREQRAEALRTAEAIRASQAAGFGSLGQGGASRTSAQIDAGRALKAEKATATALAAANEEVARSEAALATAQATRATATVAATEATKAATFAAKAGSAAAALFAGALTTLTAALPVIAIGALVAAVMEYRRASQAAEASVKDMVALSKELAANAQSAANNAHAAAGGIDAAGDSAAANTGKMLRFAGAVGDAAQKLRDLADARKKQAVDEARDRVTRAENAVENLSANQRNSTIAGGLFLTVNPSRAAKEFADARNAQQQLDGTNRILAQARKQLADAEKRSAESYVVKSDHTGGRDLNAELDRINQDLLVARKAGNKQQINDLEAEVYERKRTLKYIKDGQSFEAASAQASKEAAKLRSAGQEKIDAASNAKAGKDIAAQRRKDAAAVKDEANDTRAYKAAERQALDRIAQANAEISNNAWERVQIEKDRIEADRESRNEEIELQGRAGRYTKERVDHLKKLNDDAANAATHLVDLREQQRASQEALDVSLAGVDAQRDILQDQSDLATTAKERRAAELRLLDLQFREEKLRLERILALNSGASDSERAVALVDYNTLDARRASKTAAVLGQTRGPGEQFVHDLNASDLNERLEQVRVDGLKGLEDGLVSVLDGTRSVSAAFADMAKSIIADLARIAIEQAIIKPLAGSLFGGLGFADGGKVPGFSSGGAISGPGGPRSDSILAAVSNGEFIVNADATRKNLALLQAINDNKVPRFASGGLVTPTIATPRVPDIRGMGAGVGSAVTQNFDLRGALIDKDVYADMHRIAAEHAGRAGARAYAGAMRDAPTEMTKRATRRLGR